MKKTIKKMCKDIDKLLDRESKDYYDDYDYDNRKAKDKVKDNYEIGL